MIQQFKVMIENNHMKSLRNFSKHAKSPLAQPDAALTAMDCFQINDAV